MMLVLSRKLGERIVVGNNIVITVVDVSGGRVRLGVTAPRNVPVLREEVLHNARHESSAINDACTNESRYFVECG